VQDATQFLARDSSSDLGLKPQRYGGTARQSRNQNIFTEENEGNEDREKLCQKCRVFGHSITEKSNG
jgi:hypothetical protein